MKKNCTLLFLLTLLTLVRGNQVDIGIFKSASVPKKIEIRIRPDFNISSIQTLTGILYTVRWDDPTITITTQNIYPFFVAPQGSPVLYNGHYYQVFAAVPMIAMAMNANQEYLASSFTFINGDCSKFEIIEDQWTQANNGNVYLELVGLEVTGIIYQEEANYGSAGGIIMGADTINFGSSTGSLDLVGANGSILQWQRKINEGEWTNISGTAGLVSFSEIPQTMGDYYYRSLVQNGSCQPVYSDQHHILVATALNLSLTLFLEGPFQNGEMTTTLNFQNLIPLSQPYFVSPWNYSGTENVSTIPANVVDWVLVELRESSAGPAGATPDRVIESKAGFLMSNGSIKGLNGIQNLQFLVVYENSIYIVLYHRNHMSVISANSPAIINGNCFYDFSSGENQVLGGNLGHKEIANGIWGMRAGDGNSDGYINDTDNLNFWNTNAGTRGYISSDYSMDSQIDNKDKDDLWIENWGYSSQVPE